MKYISIYNFPSPPINTPLQNLTWNWCKALLATDWYSRDLDLGKHEQNTGIKTDTATDVWVRIIQLSMLSVFKSFRRFLQTTLPQFHQNERVPFHPPVSKSPKISRFDQSVLEKCLKPLCPYEPPPLSRIAYPSAPPSLHSHLNSTLKWPSRRPDRQCLLGALLPRAWHPGSSIKNCRFFPICCRPLLRLALAPATHKLFTPAIMYCFAPLTSPPS